MYLNLQKYFHKKLCLFIRCMEGRGVIYIVIDKFVLSLFLIKKWLLKSIICLDVKNGNKHRNMVHSSRPKMFSCAVCGEAFLIQSQLTNHGSVDSQEKSFPCSICGKLFRTNTLSTKHRSVSIASQAIRARKIPTKWIIQLAWIVLTQLETYKHTIYWSINTWIIRMLLRVLAAGSDGISPYFSE